MKLTAILTILFFSFNSNALPEVAQLKGTLRLQKQQSPIVVNLLKIEETHSNIKYRGDLKTNCELCIGKNNLDINVTKKNLTLDGIALLEKRANQETYHLELNSSLEATHFQIGDQITMKAQLIQRSEATGLKTIDSGTAILSVVKVK